MSQKFTWLKFSQEPHIECSSRGVKVLSALYAYMDDGRNIESHYQCDVKGYDVGGKNWRKGKGRPPKSHIPRDELYQKYKALWKEYLPNTMLDELINQPVRILTDSFATSEINQAHAIADILNEYMENDSNL